MEFQDSEKNMPAKKSRKTQMQVQMFIKKSVYEFG